MDDQLKKEIDELDKLVEKADEIKEAISIKNKNIVSLESEIEKVESEQANIVTLTELTSSREQLRNEKSRITSSCKKYKSN